MKRFNILSLLIVFFASSCSTDFLELSNPNDLTDETFFKNKAQLQSSVDAAYANMQSKGLFIRHFFFMHDNMAHEVSLNPQHETDKRQYFDFNFDANHQGIFTYWDNCFRGINKANFVISNQDKFENVTQDDINRALGETYFMRAFYYHLLVTRFGGVPIYTELTDIPQPRATKEEVYDFIFENLNYATELLPDRLNTDGGRATVGAAWALKGKMHLYLGEWQAARDSFEKVTGYNLVADYMDNFLEETEYNEESIFEVGFTREFGWSDADTWWNEDASGMQYVSLRGQEYGWNDWFNSYPSDDLLDEYEDNDPRYVANFYTDGEMFNNGTEVVSLPDHRAAWKKYQNYYQRPNEEIASGINHRVIRYADVLLMWAEAENELGNTSKAVELMNQVRDRVGMPRYGTSEMNVSYPVGNKQQIFDAIVHERKVELAGEQVRLNDLLRWNLAESFLAGTGFVKGKHELLPIPQKEIDVNPVIDEADQNPGY
ncbi:RagB/SusD family nutrient uptake outer membrane protein [Sediminitomix flava]|uniref:Putative outer membrane starch-binding protein n=1 Tax=Sediminitomix flava TaxID=379075 RepID=A0A315ZX55_SEDFL|nr:RagB/SusD family nutrient uptake outer membrane protein [Sediminitomix flava]PWJ41907.1 putative outer membrane starch-binding protein [Sediminitomix flava]